MAYKRRILHISEKDERKEFERKGFHYKHFNYMAFYEEDDIMGMWDRISSICHSFQPHLIIVNFKHDDCMNDYEHACLQKFGITLKVYG